MFRSAHVTTELSGGGGCHPPPVPFCTAPPLGRASLLRAEVATVPFGTSSRNRIERWEGRSRRACAPCCRLRRCRHVRQDDRQATTGSRQDQPVGARGSP